MFVLWLTEIRQVADKWFSEGVTCVCGVERLNKHYLIQPVDKHEHRSDISFTVFWDVASCGFTK